MFKVQTGKIKRWKIRESFVRVMLLLLAAVTLFSTTGDTVRAADSNSALKWTTQATTTANGMWQAVTYSPELERFVAVANISSFPTATNRRIMWSDDGVNWVLAPVPTGSMIRPVYTSVTWSPDLNLFVVVMCADSVATTCISGIGNSVFTSPDGNSWTQRTSPDTTSAWRSITWGDGKFVAVADLGTNRIMTSTDGTTWVANAALATDAWRSVTYSPELDLFVAVATSGTNRVMTSPDGTTWTPRTAAEANSWTNITWSPERDLFVAVATDGANRVMTSPNGIDWTARSASAANTWRSVTWSAELDMFLAVADTGTDRVMRSTDGFTWTGMPAASDNGWTSVVWAPEKRTFVAVASGNATTTRAMTGAMATTTANNATSITSNSATLNGDYEDGFVGSNVNVFFRYRIAGSGDPYTETTPQAMPAEGSFTADITNLTPNNVTYEYKAVLQWPSNGGTQTLESGLETFTTEYADDDNDSVPNVIEDAAPNGGDANDDGTLDSAQPFVASLVNSVTGQYSVLELDAACQIDSIAVQSESSNSAEDDSFDYPVGLMNFIADCGTPNFTANVQQYYFGFTDINSVVRKYNPTTQAYFDIEDAMKEYFTIGTALTKVSFQVTDGDILDMDDTANGVITDPAGLGVEVEEDGGLANTGTSQLLYIMAGLLLAAGPIAIVLKRSLLLK